MCACASAKRKALKFFGICEQTKCIVHHYTLDHSFTEVQVETSVSRCFNSNVETTKLTDSIQIRPSIKERPSAIAHDSLAHHYHSPVTGIAQHAHCTHSHTQRERDMTWLHCSCRHGMFAFSLHFFVVLILLRTLVHSTQCAKRNGCVVSSCSFFSSFFTLIPPFHCKAVSFSVA